MDRYLYCMMEVGTREFLARCLTACIAAERGFTVLLGHQHTLTENASILPKGVYFSKGANAVAVTNMKTARRRGHLCVACEEENFFRVLTDNPLDVCDNHLPSVCDLFLAMGEEEESYIRQKYDHRLPVIRCGNARADILRPELQPMFDQEVSELKARFGSYILVNSNPGIINSALPKNSPNEIFEHWLDVDVFSDHLSKKQKADVFQDFINFDEGNALALRGVLAGLASGNQTVLFRPHPGEISKTWERIIENLDASNIQIMAGGSHIPVILGAELVVHTSCTTGVEALLANIPSLSIRPSDARAYDYYLSNRFNVVCASPSEALEIIERHMTGDPTISEARSHMVQDLGYYLDATDGGALAAERIVSAIEHLVETSPRGNQSQNGEGQLGIPAIRENREFANGTYLKQKLGVTADLVFSTVKSITV